jgi:hypothetical protein
LSRCYTAAIALFILLPSHVNTAVALLYCCRCTFILLPSRVYTVAVALYTAAVVVSDVGKRGPSDQCSMNVDRPINNCHLSMCHVSTYSRPINDANQSAIDMWHAKLQHDVYNIEYPFVTTEPKSAKKINKISCFAIEHFRSKAKLADFRPMFHGDPAGIRS